MRAKYSFSSKKTKRATKSPKMRKQRDKYPEMLNQIILESDIILEVLDARFVALTWNKEISEEIKKQNKKLIYVLNKSDLKNVKTNLKPFIKISCKTREGIKKLREMIKRESKKIEKDKIHIGIVGYPNTGKSSLINLLIGKSSAGTGADAGFTRGIQKLKLDGNIILLDTPGVIPKKDYSGVEGEKIAHHVMVGGRSYSQVKDPEMVVAILMKEFKDILEKHYKIKSDRNPEIFLEELGKRKNFLKKGGEINVDKTARLVLKDWQNGTIRI